MKQRTAPCWFASEEAIRLSLLPKVIPPTANGRRVSLASVYRWAQVGIRGVRLRTFNIGGSKFTTRQEVERWSAALSQGMAA